MAMYAALISGLVVWAQATGPGGAGSPVVLACKLPAQAVVGSAAAAPAERTFRVAPGSFQEWDAGKRTFGPNLCLAFACAKTPDRTEANVSTASVVYTVGIINGTGEAYWRAVGASGLAANHGSCRVVTAPKSGTP